MVHKLDTFIEFNDIMDEIDLELNLKLFCDPLYKNNTLKSKG